MSTDTTRVAVIGGGMSGLACARELSRAGIPATVFDKARGPGGRVSTRHTSFGSFDHGAQYFTARHPMFADVVGGWERAGWVRVWEGRMLARKDGSLVPARGSDRRYVGVPGMNVIGRAMAEGLDYRPRHRVDAVEGRPGAWSLKTPEGGQDGFTEVVLAMPPEQAAVLAPDLKPHVKTVVMEPCWALMLTTRSGDREFEGVFLDGPELAWASCNLSKPGRGPEATWVFHATPEWSRDHLEEPVEAVRELLVRAAIGELELDSGQVLFSAAHRWRYSRPREPLSASFVRDARRGLSACGDWCGGPRVEGAFLSGLRLGQELVRVSGRENTGAPDGPQSRQGRIDHE